MKPAAPIEHRCWHPVAAAADLPADRPLAVRLLEQDLVLWRDADGAPRAFADRCPHRGAQLSLGRIEQGALQCPYHGWRFEGSGRCVAIPALPDFRPPAGHRACAHEAVEAYGLVWVRLAADAAGEAPGAQGLPLGVPGPTPGVPGPALDASGPTRLPDWPAEHDPRLRKLLCGPYDVATSAPRIVENFLDMAHFGFVHEGWLGDTGHASVPDYRIERDPAGGLRAVGCRAWQPRSNRLSTEGSWVDYQYAVPAPFTAVLTKLPQAQDGYRDEIALFVCPVGQEACRVWFRLAVTDFEASDQTLRAFQHEIFTQDRPVLESQRPRRLPLAEGAELHCAADRTSAAYRRWLRELGVGFGVTR